MGVESNHDDRQMSTAPYLKQSQSTANKWPWIPQAIVVNVVDDDVIVATYLIRFYHTSMDFP